MTVTPFVQRTHPTADAAPLVIARTEVGFRVYAPSDPEHVFDVNGTPDAPTCTCPGFHSGQNNHTRPCAHIAAVLHHARDVHASAVATPSDDTMTEQRSRRARTRTMPASSASTQMTLKRSVSPDGRIDALSVEFSCPVDADAPETIKAHAVDTLTLQSAIVTAFVQAQRPAAAATEASRAAPQPVNGAVPARLVSIGGLDGKWGRRLFITIQVNGRMAKLFGSSKQLAAALASAGFANREIAEGVTLDLPCRAVTKPSADGRYLDVEQILPADVPPLRRWP